MILSCVVAYAPLFLPPRAPITFWRTAQRIHRHDATIGIDFKVDQSTLLSLRMIIIVVSWVVSSTKPSAVNSSTLNAQGDAAFSMSSALLNFLRAQEVWNEAIVSESD